MKENRVIRKEWRLVLKEWSSILWGLATFIAIANETRPTLIEDLQLGLSQVAVTRITIVMGLVGLAVKFIPQYSLIRERMKREAEDDPS